MISSKRKKDLMKQEWKSVLHSTWLKIVLVAIITIPMLYSGIFLGSMWDPYGNTKDIPVAVVNKDQKVSYNDATLDVGNELVKNLKDNNSMHFEFVDETQAMEGLKDGSYYMVITIPSDFSSNATTLLDKEPKKMELSYTTNPGSNYIATKMDDSAMAKIKDSISDTVTETYADTLFSQIKSVSGGLKDASDGSNALVDGAKSAENGSKEISDNLKVLASSTLTFQDGTDTLVKGLSTYTTGVASVDAGSNQLASGLEKLNQQSATLASGTSSLQQGSKELAAGVKEYTSAVGLLEEKSKLLAGNNTSIVQGIKQLSDGSAALSQGNQKVLTGLQTLSETLDSTMKKNGQQITGVLKANAASVAQMDELSKQVKQLKDGLDQADAQQQAVIASLKTVATSDEASRKTLDGVISALETKSTSYQEVSKSLEAFLENGTQLQTLLNGNSQAIQELSGGLQSVKQVLDVKGSTPETMGLIQGVEQVQTSLDQMKNALASNSQLTQGIQQYTDGVTAISDGVAKINDKSAVLTSGAQNLASGTVQLQEHVPALLTGIEQLNDGGKALKDGTGQLMSNSPAVLDGAQQLADGSVQLQSGATRLAAGSDTLYNGLLQLKDGSSTLHGALSDGAQKSDIQVTNKTNEMLASPVILQHEEISTVENNGHAMAPYMMSVGLYVACMAFTLMYPLLKNNVKTKSGFKLWLSKASVMYVISTLMAVVMIGALMLVNGLSPFQIAQTFGMAILVGAAFMSLIVFFSITCGKIGSFLVLIFMVLQLGGAAGTYPIETSSSFYHVIHPLMPFSYSVDAFRHTLAMGGDISVDIMVFVGIIIVFSILSILFYRWKASISEEQYEQTLLAKFH